MQKLRYFFRSVGLSIRIKSVPSRIATVAGLVAAFLPMLISLKLAAFTDVAQQLFGNPALLNAAFISFAWVVLLYLAQTFFQLVQNYFAKEDAARIKRYVKEETLKLLCEIPYKYIENYDGFHERMSFIKTYGGEKTAGSISLILGWMAKMVSFISVAAILFTVNPWIVAALIGTSVPAAVLSLLQKDETYRSRTKWMKEGTLTIHYSDLCRLNAPMKEIRFFGLYPYIKERWRELADGYIDKRKRVISRHVWYNSIADIFRNGVYFIVILIAVWEVFHDPAKGLGTFMLVLSSSEQLQAVTTALFVEAVSIFTDMKYVEDFFRLLEMERESGEVEKRQKKAGNGITMAEGTGNEAEEKAGYGADMIQERKGSRAKERAGHGTNETTEKTREAAEAVWEEAYERADIVFENVSFSYPGNVNQALDHVTVQIRQGEKIAIVGANGSGKSTFVSLLCGFYQPEEGNITINGEDSRKNMKKLRRSVSAIFQRFCQYQDTLRNNITISSLGRAMEDERIMRLAKSTGADEAIRSQGNALDEMVGIFSDSGNNLSGGQWQKIAITRALYRDNACIYILDEPTAALDPIGEASLYRNFRQLTGDKTTILISHRLGVASVVDRILVFDKGRIVEDGNHGELMARNGLYAEMYRAQARWYAQAQAASET
ncbi:MAG: ABC transporter ATP-binding protein [Lachnospiraceae bacterium]|jgi:ABC-type multidrug transport system fused ATPase/permease subunit|nr:ABC transporter ATP-binding protein [Lachnospiraceae bacterium]